MGPPTMDESDLVGGTHTIEHHSLSFVDRWVLLFDVYKSTEDGSIHHGCELLPTLILAHVLFQVHLFLAACCFTSMLIL